MTFGIYIAGPMSGLPEFNYPAFEAEATRLRAKGYRVVSPHEISGPNPQNTWDFYIRQSICGMMSCDTIFLLPGWETSRGAKIEYQLATSLGYAIMGTFSLTNPTGDSPSIPT